MEGDGAALFARRAFELARTGCDANKAADCVTLGDVLASEILSGLRGVPVDGAAATAAYERGCELEDAVGCGSAGINHEFAAGVPEDLARAESFYARACELGSAPACSRLGSIIADDARAAELNRRAIELHLARCDQGDAWACALAARVLLRGRGVTDEKRAAEVAARAVKVYERECQAGHAGGCDALAQMYRDAIGVPRDEIRGDEYAALACKHGGHCSPVVARRRPTKKCPVPAVSAALQVSATSGAVAGVVQDGWSCDRIAGATIVATSAALPGSASAISDEAGQFVLRDLPPGTYRVVFYYGDEQSQLDGVVVGAGKVAEVTGRVP
jgi:hypothetical protein